MDVGCVLTVDSGWISDEDVRVSVLGVTVASLVGSFDFVSIFSINWGDMVSACTESLQANVIFTLQLFVSICDYDLRLIMVLTSNKSKRPGCLGDVWRRLTV